MDIYTPIIAASSLVNDSEKALPNSGDVLGAVQGAGQRASFKVSIACVKGEILLGIESGLRQ